MTGLAEVEETLSRVLGAVVEDIGTRATDRLAAAHDASHYLLTPQAVVRPTNAQQVADLMAAASHLGTSITFRSGGTSLSGQSVTDGVLVDTRRHFRGIDVLDDGQRVRCGPGATVRSVNARLHRHRRALGPDPASEIACTIGGVVANNSSGMACGIDANTYRTLDSSVFVLPSGTVVDTSAEDCDEALAAAEPELYSGLLEIRDEINGDPAHVDRLKALYSIKNTMGYGLNSFIDFHRPVDILEHLIIGSEGTLAFLAEAVFRTVEVKPHVSTGMLFFEDLISATASLPEVVATGPATVELLDATSLRVAQRDPDAPQAIRELEVQNHCALLVEFQESTADQLADTLQRAAELWPELPLSTPMELTSDPDRRATFWRTRKGLFTAVAGNRPQGTTALLEDIAVPVDRLGQTCERLTELFETYEYPDAVIFGHAKDGNIHFMITEEFGTGEIDVSREVMDRYEAFTEDMVDLVLNQGGTLKAEHGTGRIMAPFLRRQVGEELFAIMRRIKDLVDPTGLLNPGVLLTDDPRAHTRHIKTVPVVEEEVDRCVECGYCEPVCPSRDVTSTPRERIVLRRELARAEAVGDGELASQLRREYQYEAVETCAVDGMCETACPVFINTGDLMRRFRAEQTSRVSERVWNTAARHWGPATRTGSLALHGAAALPTSVPEKASTVARKILGEDTVPHYSGDLPHGGQARQVITAENAEIVWFASCTSTLFGVDGGSRSGAVSGVAEAFSKLCAAAGVTVRTPDDIPSLCCGTPWKSKGHLTGYETMRQRVLGSLATATDNGRIPMICDASSCTEGLELLLEGSGVRTIDAVDFVADTILPRIERATDFEVARLDSLVLHPTCSSTRGGTNPSLRKIADAAADRVEVPDSWGCCGFAGDRGMLHPELTAAATADQAQEANAYNAQAYASLNRTCEMAMSRATGQNYRHVLEVLAESLKL